ncbi:MAG: zinc ribbon domain-containing protein [Candidatus Sigynarchaeota archaeon]
MGFGKLIGLSISLIILNIVLYVLLATIQTEAWGWTPAHVAAAAGLNSATPITLSVVLCALAIVGKMVSPKNGIVGFVFGIICLICSIGILVDRAINVFGWIDNLVEAIDDLPAVDAQIEIPLRIAQLVVFGALVGVAIPSIVVSANIIKDMKDAVKNTGPSTSKASTPPPKASTGSSEFCSSCGAAVQPGSSFCKKCGAKV